MARYSESHENVRDLGRGPPPHLLSGYQVVKEDERNFGRRGTTLDYSTQGGGLEPHRRYNTIQGTGGARQNTIQEEGNYTSYPMTLSNSATGFTGPEPIIHSQAEFDTYIQKMQTNTYSDDAPREPTGTKTHSAVLRILKPVRYEMPNHPSYHGELTSKEAEGRLSMAMPTRGNCYLTRYSKTRESYVLSAIVFHDGIREPVHMKLSIDTDNNCYSLEGSQKLFRTLEELLNYFENNALSSDIRNIGTICPHPDHYMDSYTSTKSPTTGITKEFPETPRSARSPSNDSSSDSKHQSMFLEMQKNFLDELSKQREEHKREVEQQREEHKRELEEERRLYREEIERERQMLKEQLEEKQKRDNNAAQEQAAQNNTDDKKKRDSCTIL